MRLPHPDQPVRDWHVSPLVDVAAYHYSWLLILIPLALAGAAHPGDYLGLWAFGITVSFLHRHFTLPYVYLDGGVFQSFKTRFTLVPAVLFFGFLCSVMLQQARVPARFVTALDLGVLLAAVAVIVALWWRDRAGVCQPLANRVLVAAVAPFGIATVCGALGLWSKQHLACDLVVGAFVVVAALRVGGRRLIAVVVSLLGAGVWLHVELGGLNPERMKGGVVVGAAAMVAALWNIWHTAAQKVGILRVYNAKSSAAVALKVPLWVDRLLVMGWFPFLGAFLVTRERDTILTQGKVVRVWLEPIVDAVSAGAQVLLPLGALLIVASIAIFVRYEQRATGLRSMPRLSMALGMTLLSASFLFVSPLKCYVAYGFSHAIEYVVFVWAFQRRRYAQPLAPPPLLQRLLRHTGAFYAVFTFVIAGSYFYLNFGNAYGFNDAKIKIFSYGAGTWLYCWAIWHSFTHFYFDGFLWKMRAPVRAHL